MQKRLNKYEVGDKVVISRYFKRIPHGHMVDGDPIICEIKSYDLTSIGPSYKLHNKNVQLHICYWEEDIDYKIHDSSDEEKLWKVWGDR